jgi:hypothetical protein
LDSQSRVAGRRDHRLGRHALLQLDIPTAHSLS